MEMEEEPMQACGNCQKLCAVTKLDLHEAYCRRNIRKCKLCPLMVDINEETTHFEHHHAPKPCPFCQTPQEPPALPLHLHTCPARPLPCKFCQNPHAAHELTKHEDTCGSRTKLCEICMKYIKISGEKQHLAKCKGTEVRRNESQEERRGQPNRIVRERMNSNDQVRRELGLPVSPRMPVKTMGTVVQGEMIRQLVDPVPISVRLAQRREKERRGLQ